MDVWETENNLKTLMLTADTWGNEKSLKQDEAYLKSLQILNTSDILAGGGEYECIPEA